MVDKLSPGLLDREKIMANLKDLLATDGQAPINFVLPGDRNNTATVQANIDNNQNLSDQRGVIV